MDQKHKASSTISFRDVLDTRPKLGFLAAGSWISGASLMGTGKAADRHPPHVPALSVSMAPQ
jgi:hypothetical protein